MVSTTCPQQAEVPHYGSFIVSMAVREDEKEAFMMNTMLPSAHDKLKESERYYEGYAVKFIVDDENSSEECEKFIHELMEERIRK